MKSILEIIINKLDNTKKL